MRFGVATRPLPNLGIVRFLPIGPPAVRLLPRRFWMPIRVTGSQAAAGGGPRFLLTTASSATLDKAHRVFCAMRKSTPIGSAIVKSCISPQRGNLAARCALGTSKSAEPFFTCRHHASRSATSSVDH